jgi:hypothetical protein
MSTGESVIDSVPGTPPAESEPAPGRSPRLLRVLLFGFAAAITIGLALASWYVGVRIVTGPVSTVTSSPAF